MECSEGLPSYYVVLGVNFCSSDEEIRRAYHKLAMQWHPDKWARSPAFLGEAKLKFQQIQEAYSVLSDRSKRTLYDAGLYDPGNEEDEVEGFTDFLQEMASLIKNSTKKEKTYSMEELQSMFWDMAQSFEISECSSSLQQPMYDTQRFGSLYESASMTENSCLSNFGLERHGFLR